MCRLARRYFSVVLLVGSLAAGTSPALAANTDWAVNGTPLAPGQEVPVKFASITPIQLVGADPAQNIDITCTSWKAKGTLVGGEIGTGELIKPKFAHCTQTEEGAPVKARVQITSVTLRTGANPPVGSAGTTTFKVAGEDCTFKKPHCEETASIMGTVDGFGPTAGASGNVIDFPQPALPSSALTIGGGPAALVGKAVFTLKKHATLSQVEL